VSADDDVDTTCCRVGVLSRCERPAGAVACFGRRHTVCLVPAVACFGRRLPLSLAIFSRPHLAITFDSCWMLGSIHACLLRTPPTVSCSRGRPRTRGIVRRVPQASLRWDRPLGRPGAELTFARSKYFVHPITAWPHSILKCCVSCTRGRR